MIGQRLRRAERSSTRGGGSVRLKLAKAWAGTRLQETRKLWLSCMSGVANIEGHPDVPLKEKMLAYIPPATRHKVTNNGTRVLEYVWVVAPTAVTAK